MIYYIDAMVDNLPESYFKETTPRNRSLEFFDRKLKLLAETAYKVSGLEDGKVPTRDFPSELSGGLSTWIETEDRKGSKIRILDAGAGEGNLARDLSNTKDVEVVSVDLYPPQAETQKNFIQHDLNKPLPFDNESFSMCVYSFVLPYLKDPVRTINDAIRTTKTGGYILLNGANRIYLEKESDYFFSTNNPLNDSDLVIYNSEVMSGGDWVLIKVNNPNYQYKASLDMSKSYTVENKGEEKMYMPVFGTYGTSHQTRDIKDLARFVYKHKDQNKTNFASAKDETKV